MDQQPQDSQRERSLWPPTREQVLWTVGIVAVLTVSVVIGYRYGISLWDWLKLLIVPAVIAGGGLWFNVQQREREQRLANERAQDEALQGYLDGMSELLTDKEQPLHRAQPGDSLSTVARARTLTVLSRLDSGRKRSVLEFLYKSRLIDQERALLGESDLIERRHNIISLEQANLSGANLSELDLRGADLSYANLSGANLSYDDLGSANLIRADLRGATLWGATLIRAELIDTNLSGADLRGAYLSSADLIRENDPIRAGLSDAEGVTEEQLGLQTTNLEGATMPNGRKYEEWLKDKESHGEDE